MSLCQDLSLKEESSHKDADAHRNGSAWYFFLTDLSSDDLTNWAVQPSILVQLLRTSLFGNYPFQNRKTAYFSVYFVPTLEVGVFSKSVFFCFIVSWGLSIQIAIRNLYKIFLVDILIFRVDMGFSFSFISFLDPQDQFLSLIIFSITDLIPGRKKTYQGPTMQQCGNSQQL